MSGPLEGLRILDLTRLLPGDYCTLLLADLGADVIKVEQPGRGDYIRWVPPLVDGEGAAHRALNRGKRSITLDLGQPGGVALLKRLGADADALVESLRPGIMERLGVGYGVLAEANPRLVYCSLTGYGQDGPYSQLAGHDINYMGYAGLLHATGELQGPPVLPAVQVADFGGGMAAAVGILAALREASATGRGREVDVSMFDVVVSWGAVLSSWYLATGSVPERGRMPLSGGLACYRVYAAGDGKYLAVGALEPQFWRHLCVMLGLREFIDVQMDPSRQGEIATRLTQVFSTRSRDEWVEELADLDTCVGPVNDVSEALTDPHAAQRGMLATANGTPVGPGPTIKVSGHEVGDARPAPSLGEHTDEVLEALGLGPEEISTLRTSGVL